MQTEAPVALRRFWQILWGLSVGMILLLLFATLTDRPYSPDALQQFPREMLETGRQFTREVRTAATIQGLLSLGVMLALSFHPVGARILGWLEEIARGRLWLAVTVVAMGITIITALVELPFSFYMSHLHEKAYGLTNQSAGDWFRDHLQGMAFGFVISMLLWIPIYWMIRRWPRGWWLPASALNIGLSALMVLLYPVLIMPMFNDLRPVQDPEVVAMIDRLAQRAGVEVGQVKEMVVSHKSSRVNAMVTGLGPTKQVILFDTLLQQFHLEEVEVVMAHELSHAANNDVVTGFLVGSAVEMATLMLVAWVLSGMVGVGPLRMPTACAARGLAIFLLATALVGQVTSPVHNIVSRKMEVRSDQFALEVTGNPEAFLSSFRKLAGGNPSDVDPPAIVEFLSHSHPSVMNRIRTAQQAAGHSH